MSSIVYLGSSFSPVSVQEYLEDDMSYLVEFYKDRHMHPEISFEEHKTSAKLSAELKQLGWDVTEGVGQTVLLEYSRMEKAQPYFIVQIWMLYRCMRKPT